MLRHNLELLIRCLRVCQIIASVGIGAAVISRADAAQSITVGAWASNLSNVDCTVVRFNATDDSYLLNQELGLSLPISATWCAARLDFGNFNPWIIKRRMI